MKAEMTSCPTHQIWAKMAANTNGKRLSCNDSDLDSNEKRRTRAQTRKIRSEIFENPSKTTMTFMTWDVDPIVTQHIYDDLGVREILVEDDIVEKLRPTPPIMVNNGLFPPKPRKVETFHSHPGESRLRPLQQTTPCRWMSQKHHRQKNDATAGQVPWERLSDELLLSVFSWLNKRDLSRCMMVCSRWHNVGLDESLWGRIDLSGKALRPAALGYLVARGVAVLRLARTDVCSPVFHDEMGLNCMSVQECPLKLQYLDLSMCNIEVSSVNEILRLCCRLVKLSLESCSVSGETLRLTSLNIAWTNLNYPTLAAAVSNLPRSLEHLNLSGFRSLLTDEAVFMVVQRCPGLIELDVSDSSLLTPTTLETLINGLLSLRHLALSRCYHINTAYLVNLGAMQKLSTLEVFGILCEIGIANLRELMPRVKVNTRLFSTVARPTTGCRWTSIWGLKCPNM
ncbi:SKP2 [Branchiostoma lanceolatum]|uniref:SKP2 protein n=2 Tax=Branchiostoma lanceolatum TaxID=7740 RepID=A0A8J9YXK6_BRALA|nr:SKP2 [Branchiostoma lanceolatum]